MQAEEEANGVEDKDDQLAGIGASDLFLRKGSFSSVAEERM